MTNPIIQAVEDLDTTDMWMVSDRCIETLVRDWQLVSSITAHPDAETATRVGIDMTVEADIEIQFNDASSREIRALVAANDEFGIFGLRNIKLLPKAA
jgi:hypothetical protein